MSAFPIPAAAAPFFENLNLFLKPDERIALIGENGEGKTTIVKLLTRLYDPTFGQILLDGVDLREYDLEDYSSNIAVIFQDFMRYDMTAWKISPSARFRSRENLAQVELAAKKSLAEGVIQKLAARLRSDARPPF